MKMKLAEFTELRAKEICNWEYEDIYTIYNYPNWNKVCEEKWDIAVDEKRKKEFFSIIDENDILCAYIRLQDKKESVLIGVGLKPSLCGQGLGKTLMGIVKNKCSISYPNKKIELEVRSFNERAIKCYKNAGFKEKEIYIKNTPIGYGEFIKMELVLI